MNYRARPRLVLADDHRLLADACCRLLEPEFEVVDVVTDGRALLKSALALKPDVVIVDVSMPHMNGLDAAEQIKHRMPSVKVVFLTMRMDVDLAAEAFRRGASAYVLKHSGAAELMTAIRQVLRGQSYLSSLIASETLTSLLDRERPHRDGKRLTLRQNEVLQLLVEGMSMKEVASALGVTMGTVAFHKYQMMAALGLKTNAELLRYAITRHA